MFDVRHIAFTYRAQPVLRDVSFTVSPGETVAVVGDNGAGKTTLLKTLATVLVPEKGQILVDGRDMLAKPVAYRRLLGYLPETPALYDDMTVKAYLEYRARLKGENEKRLRHRVEEAVRLCRATEILRRPVRALSYGLRKRVALADAVLLRPRVLLLDDVLAGLDFNLRAAAGEIVSEVSSFSCVVATGHEIVDLARWATKFLVLRGGVIAAEIPAAGVEPAALVERVGTALRGGAA